MLGRHGQEKVDCLDVLFVCLSFVGSRQKLKSIEEDGRQLSY